MIYHYLLVKRSLQNSVILIFFACFTMSCTSDVELQYLGDFKLNTRLATTYGGKPINDTGYRLIRTPKEFLSLCTDQPLEFSIFLKECVEIDTILTNYKKLEDILRQNDIVISTVPILHIRRGTEYTESDGCPYLAKELVEVVLASPIGDGRMYIYTISSKGKYRFTTCP